MKTSLELKRCPRDGKLCESARCADHGCEMMPAGSDQAKTRPAGVTDRSVSAWLAWRIKMFPVDLAFLIAIALLFWIAS